MKLSSLGKTLADELFVIMFMSLLDCYYRILPGMLITTAITVAVVLLLQYYDYLIIRLTAPLISIAALSTVTRPDDRFFLSLFIVVSWALVALRSYQISYENYRYWFAFEGLLALVDSFILVISPGYYPSSVICGCLTMAIGALVMRRKRMGAGADKKSRLLSATSLVTVVIVLMVTGIIVYGVVTGTGPIMQVLLLPLGYIIKFLIHLGLKFGDLIKNIQSEKPFEPEKTPTEIYNEIFNYTPAPDEDVKYAVLLTLERMVLILLAIAVVVIIVLIIIKAIRIVTSDDPEENEAFESGQDYEKGNVSPLRKLRKRREKRTGKQRIREIYREYMAIRRLQGLRITRQTTSEEIMMGEKEAAGIKLREIYLNARYKPDSQVTEEEVRAAEECLTLIKEAKETARQTA